MALKVSFSKHFSTLIFKESLCFRAEIARKPIKELKLLDCHLILHRILGDSRNAMPLPNSTDGNLGTAVPSPSPAKANKQKHSHTYYLFLDIWYDKAYPRIIHWRLYLLKFFTNNIHNTIFYTAIMTTITLNEGDFSTQLRNYFSETACRYNWVRSSLLQNNFGLEEYFLKMKHKVIKTDLTLV